MENQQDTSANPGEKYPKPPFPKQDQPVPGTEERLRPQADYREESYEGSGKLKRKKAVITGGDSGIGQLSLNTKNLAKIRPCSGQASQLR